VKAEVEAEFRDLRRAEVTSTPLVSFSGDTTLQGVLQRPTVLILECTYFTDPRSTTAQAIERGHVHEEHIIAAATQPHCQLLVLTHISPRYNAEEIAAGVQRIQDAPGTSFRSTRLIFFPP
jgi:ribonuclease BN (tRNA processing enzyme)